MYDCSPAISVLPFSSDTTWGVNVIQISLGRSPPACACDGVGSCTVLIYASKDPSLLRSANERELSDVIFTPILLSISSKFLLKDWSGFQFISVFPTVSFGIVVGTKPIGSKSSIKIPPSFQFLQIA